MSVKIKFTDFLRKMDLTNTEEFSNEITTKFVVDLEQKIRFEQNKQKCDPQKSSAEGRRMVERKQ